MIGLGRELYRPREKTTLSEWAGKHVDFSRVQSYETPFHVKFNPELLPFWREPADCVLDPSVREIVICKCSRAGCTENVLLNPIRYHVAEEPLPILYVGAQKDSTARFHDERVKLGLKAVRGLPSKLAKASCVGTVISFDDMTLVSSYPGNRSVTKQFGYGLVLGDEVSTWPSFSADMLRKRTDTYRYAHIVLISSPDPQQKRASEKDPIFLEFKEGDQRYWMMPDPKTGDPFRFEMGDKDLVHGLKWDAGAKREDGTWDITRVKESAHYVTPSGTVIRNEEKRALVARGKWVAHNEKSSKNKRSYHINSFYMPFRSGDFGEIAAAFVTANARGPSELRTFVYEYLAEPWYGEKQTIDANEIENRRGSYRAGTRLIESPAYGYLSARRSTVIQTVDVQKDRMYCVVREWFEGGDSALVDFQETTAWKDVAALRAKHNCERVFVDLGYAGRRNEVLEQCMYGEIKGAVPMFGRDSLKEAHKVQRDYDPFEGTAKQGRVKIPVVTFNPDQVKHILARLMAGLDPRQWLLPANVTSEYIRQITAEECIDGAWVAKHKDNHATDCEAMNLVAAMILGKFSEVVPDLAAITAPQPPNAKPSRVRGVYVPD